MVTVSSSGLRVYCAECLVGHCTGKPADMFFDLTLLCSLQCHLVCMKATIFHPKFIILGRLRKLSSLPPPPLCQHSHTPPTLH